MTEKKTKTPVVKKARNTTNPQSSFIEEYQALCVKHGMRINVTPSFVSRDDGTWSVVLQTGVGEMPKQDRIEL